MTVWTWRAWSDLLVDFGRELYVPWQIAEGGALYTDLAYFNGPLSPYLNAAWFGLFGESVLTLAAANLLVLGGITLLLLRLLRTAGDRFSAGVAVAFFLLAFGFGQTNYNFVSPYSHEMTHGLLLLLLGVYSVVRFSEPGGSTWWGFGTGLFAGATFLTKPEIFLASFALPVGLGISLWLRQVPPRSWTRTVGLYLAAMLIPLILALSLLTIRIGWGAAWGGITAPWPMALDGRVTSLEFYQRILGVVPLWENLGIILFALIGIALLWLPLLPALRLPPSVGSPPAQRFSGPGGGLVVLAAAAAGLGVLAFVPYLSLSRAQPLLLLLLLALVIKRRPGPGAPPPLVARFVAQLTLLLLSLMLIAKIILATGIYHYGFALAMPGTLMLVVAALAWVPNAIGRRSPWGEAARNWSLGVLLAITGLHMVSIAARLEAKDYHAGEGVDVIRTDPVRGPVVDRALAVVMEHLEGGQTLLVLPEGVTLNFHSRTPSPTGFLNFMPPEVIHFGEDEMLRRLSETPPDILLLVQKDTEEYGVGSFGEGYGRELMEWAREGFETIEIVGDPPFRGRGGFGIEVMRKKGP